MSRAPYLHPSKRNFSTEQVGPSTHTNTYSNGVLLGNWLEDRIPPQKEAADALSPQKTTYNADFAAKKVKTRAMIVAPDLGRQLLFGQSGAQTCPPKEVLKLQQKQRMWEEQNNPDNAGFLQSSTSAASRSLRATQARAVQ